MKVLAGMLAVFILLGLGACRRTDIRTVVIAVPEMKNQACAKLVQDTMVRQPGVMAARPDFQKRELTVTYNSMVIARKNLEFAVAGAGFDALGTPAYPSEGKPAFPSAVSNLPPECK